jgi:hypothetical protein
LAPCLNSFLKQQLIWVPVIGLAWWARLGDDGRAVRGQRISAWVEQQWTEKDRLIVELLSVSR